MSPSTVQNMQNMQAGARNAQPLLTAKDLQNLLQVDRSTIYRLAESGSLPAVKVGRQWRFPAGQVHRWLDDRRVTPGGPVDLGTLNGPVSLLPAGYIRLIGDLVGEMLGVMVIVTDMTGSPLAEPSNQCGLFRAVNERSGAVQRCVSSWRDLADDLDPTPRFVPGHLDLLCARSYLRVGSELRGIVLLGGIAPSDWPPSPDRVEGMAAEFGISPATVRHHLDEVYRLDDRARRQALDALSRLARFLSEVATERKTLLGKLDAIAALAAPNTA